MKVRGQVKIPKDISAKLGLSEDARVEIEADGNRIVILIDRPRYDLNELLVGMTPDAIYGTFDWGKDVGRDG